MALERLLQGIPAPLYRTRCVYPRTKLLDARPIISSAWPGWPASDGSMPGRDLPCEFGGRQLVVNRGNREPGIAAKALPTAVWQ